MKPISYLINYAYAQVGRPYWCGTFGQIATDALYTYNKRRLPAYYTALDFPSQFGQKVHDCCGLIKGAKWCADFDALPVYIPAEDLSVAGLFQACDKRGALNSKTALRDGTLLFRGNFSHVGIYADGYVTHAKGHAYGVVREKYEPSMWAYWGELARWFDYSKTESAKPGALKVGDTVKIKEGAPVYGTKVQFASFVYKAPFLYVRAVDKNRIVISIFPAGAITGAVHSKYLTKI